MNILLQDWELPPFHLIRPADFDEAIHTALAEADQAVQRIVDNPEAATFSNTIEALEQCDTRLQRIDALLVNLNECHTSPELQQAMQTLEPEVVAFSMRTMTNQRLFDRVKQVYHSAEAQQLGAEEQMLLQRTYRTFVRHGAALPEEGRRQFSEMAIQLEELCIKFSQNALADKVEMTLEVHDPADLDGLPQSLIDEAQREAAARGKGDTCWVFTLDAPVYTPFMTHSTRRHLREQMYRLYGSIGNRGNQYDNNQLIARIVQLRLSMATLLGYSTYCDMILDDRMVASQANLRHFMQELHDAVLPAAREDLRQMQQIKDFEGEVMPWDISYLSERLRLQHNAPGSESLRRYFPLQQVREGIFALYHRLYGVRFDEAPEVPVYHHEVKVYSVLDEEQQSPLGLLYLDMHPRPSKRSGAWMTEFRPQTGSTRPQVQVVCNFSKNGMLLFDEVETFMHEMGHAMHGLLSQVRYHTLSGTNVSRDFVEMPSQLMEHWCYEAEFLQSFTDIPTTVVDSLRATRNHLAGWLCLRQLNLGMTDLAFHSIGLGQTLPPQAEEVETNASTLLIPHVAGANTATHFTHIFSGGYAAGYYGYKWAEVLCADVFGRFRDEGIFNPHTATQLRHCILERGGSERPEVLFRNFMGRDPDPQALLKDMELL